MNFPPRMKFLHFTFLAVASLLFMSCMKEKVKPKVEAPPCEDIPEVPGFGWKYKVDYPYYAYAVRNPNAPGEIIYQAYDSPAVNDPMVYKVNLTTGQKTYLEFIKYHTPRWNKKGWLTFQNFLNQQICVAKSNGDSMKQLTFGGYNISPIWSGDGSKILFTRYLDQQIYTLIVDMEGHLDTIPNIILQGGDWSPDGSKIITQGPNAEMVFITMPQKKITKMSVDQGSQVSDLRWVSNDEFIYSNRIGWNSYNLSTQVSRVLIPFCESTFYSDPSTVHGSRDILFRKTVHHYLPPDSLDVSSTIVEFNMDSKTFSAVDL
jgi:Tol biopolymer transport system component